MADSHLIDSNTLLRISRRGDPDYRMVDAALERLLGEKTILYYTDQNIAEFRDVWTRPTHKNGFGLSGETAAAEIAKFANYDGVRPGQRRGLRKLAGPCPRLQGNGRPGTRRTPGCFYARPRYSEPAHFEFG